MANFLEEIRNIPGGEHVLSCIQCGTCTGSCPMAEQMEYSPRRLIAMVRAGMRDEVLSSNSMWFCLSCYMCTARCPRGVKPTDLAHALESLAVREGFRTTGTATPAMYRSFVSSIRQNGRVHEFGMMLRYYLFTNPLAALKMTSIGLKLFFHRRMPLMPRKSTGKQDLAKIVRKFRKLREAR